MDNHLSINNQNYRGDQWRISGITKTVQFLLENSDATKAKNNLYGIAPFIRKMRQNWYQHQLIQQQQQRKNKSQRNQPIIMTNNDGNIDNNEIYAWWEQATRNMHIGGFFDVCGACQHANLKIYGDIFVQFDDEYNQLNWFSGHSRLCQKLPNLSEYDFSDALLNNKPIDPNSSINYSFLALFTINDICAHYEYVSTSIFNHEQWIDQNNGMELSTSLWKYLMDNLVLIADNSPGAFHESPEHLTVCFHFFIFIFYFHFLFSFFISILIINYNIHTTYRKYLIQYLQHLKLHIQNILHILQLYIIFNF